MGKVPERKRSFIIVTGQREMDFNGQTVRQYTEYQRFDGHRACTLTDRVLSSLIEAVEQYLRLY